MKIGFVGLGRMGYNMVLNLIEQGDEVVVYNRSPKNTRSLAKKKGVVGSFSLEEMVGGLRGRKVIWLMISAGKPVEEVLKDLVPLLKRGDIIIDGGNSNFKDSIKRYFELKKEGINLLDCGVSGGILGARNGASMMVGGNKKIFEKVEKLFRHMCVKDGYGYMGKTGSGHFVKMVHNGIEYGMMGAIAEGVTAVRDYPLKIDFKKAIKVYANGSIIESKLMSWLLDSYDKKGYLNSISGEVPLGETEKEMEDLEKIAKMDILRQARKMRVETRKKPSYAGKLISAIRNQFGGHAVNKKKR